MSNRNGGRSYNKTISHAPDSKAQIPKTLILITSGTIGNTRAFKTRQTEVHSSSKPLRATAAPALATYHPHWRQEVSPVRGDSPKDFSRGINLRGRSVSKDCFRSRDDYSKNPQTKSEMGARLCGKSREEAGNPLPRDCPAVGHAGGSTGRQSPANPGDYSGSKAATSSSPVVASTGRQSRSSGRNGSNPDRIRSASQGLRNLGNTCYMNSILQCLAKVPWTGNKDLKDDLAKEFFRLMEQMKRNDSDDPINPTKFQKQISVLGFRFSKSDQNDAHEFLVCLLNRLKKTLIDAKIRNEVEERLLGQQQNIIRFGSCDHTLVNTQSFFTIALPIILDDDRSKRTNSEINLKDCLENYTKLANVDGDALCLKCQKMQVATIETNFKKLPEILILHLKRYELETMKKLDTVVTFPISNLCIKENDATVSYDLFGVCNHFGSLRFGHYTADIKSDTGNWHTYSDSSVRQSYELRSSSSSSSSSTAYIFFYRRREAGMLNMNNDKTISSARIHGHANTQGRRRGEQFPDGTEV